MPFHFNIAREDLLRSVSAQQNITSKKGTMAILSNVLLEVENNQITFTGTDLEIGLKQVVPAEVFETGILTLPAKKLFEVAR
jgi:DNA polymerase-3 subunit beta